MEIKCYQRIYHPYTKWEDYPAGFYNNCTGAELLEKRKASTKMFMDESLTRENMLKVIDEWVYSCEHNFTNEGLNKIAYLGQAACCIYGGSPCTATMDIWSKLPKDVRDRADSIALEVINIWESRNRSLQICLNLD